ncbi:MAG: hypothetical protein QG636_525 [Patescibacteria group bacterium]|jgi:hypothetical protein|nr:hypothetical protein [Patescibacteria group bacterium]
MTETPNTGPRSLMSSSPYLPRPYASANDECTATSAQTIPEVSDPDVERRRQIVQERMDNLADTPGAGR